MSSSARARRLRAKDLIANIEGLSGSSASNPLTQFPGVAIAIVVALMVLLGGVFLAGRVRAPKSDGTPA